MPTLLAVMPPVLAMALLLRGTAPPLAAGVSLMVAVALLPAFGPPWPVLQASVPGALALGGEVAAIMLGGVLLYALMRRAGADRGLGTWLASKVADPADRLLLMTLGVAPFVESVTGFGVGAVVTYPVLVQMGFAPRQAALVALLGLVTVPWGALAPGTLVASNLAGVPFQRLGEASAALSLPVFLICGGAALRVGMRRRLTLRQVGKLLVVAASLWGGVWLANHLAGTPPAGALGSLAGVLAGLVVSRTGNDGAAHRQPTRERTEGDMPIARALAPYLVLVGLLVLSRAAASVAARTGWPMQPAASRSLLWLWVSCAFACPWFRLSVQAVAAALREAVVRWAPAALTTMLFVLLGNVMTAAGMAAALAEAASSLGSAYLALAPWVGALGGFITGSNTGANAMFAAAQAGAAMRLGYPLERTVALHNVAASLWTMASAPRVALMANLAGSPQEFGHLFKPVALADVTVMVVLSLISLIP